MLNRIALALALSSCSLLTGCFTLAHAILSPALDAGIKSAVYHNATPESMGVSTAQYRGYDCAQLDALIPELRKSGADPALDPVVRKAMGWHVDAANQVRAEKGCGAPGGATATANATARPSMFGYCWATTGVLPRKAQAFHYVTPVFAYADWYADQGAAEGSEFKAYAQARLGGEENDGVCHAEDSRAKADAARERTAGMFWLQRNITTRQIAWAPAARTTAAKPPQPAATVAADVRPANAPPAPPATPVATGPATNRFCHSLFQPVGKPGGANSAVWEDPRSDGSAARRLVTMAAFGEHMRKQQPGLWPEMPPGQCVDARTCNTSFEPRGSTHYILMQFCYPTRVMAEASRGGVDRIGTFERIVWAPTPTP